MSEESSVRPFDGDLPDGVWADAGFLDPFSNDSFSQEIANVDASDWDVDADSLWGEDVTDFTDSGGDLPGADLLG